MDYTFYIRNTIIIFASLSLISSIFIFVIFFAYRPLRKAFAFKLVLYLTVSNIITMIGRFLVFPTGNNMV
jgi:hypothetical protein